jgi:autotransporter-associated beta strand protein
MRVDPFEVQSFQLTIEFNSNRAQLDTSFGNGGGLAKFPFSIAVDPTPEPNVLKVSGATVTPSIGDVDVLELRFIDLHPHDPAFPVEDAFFTVEGMGDDFIVVMDSLNPGSTITYDAFSIGSTTRFATAGVSPLIWDPDGGYNNGTTGGAGTWDNASIRWDNLPMIPNIMPPFSDVTWNNANNVHDVAVFGGNPGTGVVQLAGVITAGGLQFDMPGYDLTGGTLVLSAPGGALPTVEAGEDATISAVLAGTGLRKTGPGTLTLSNNNTYAGPTRILGGTLAIFQDANLGLVPAVPTPGALHFDGGALRTVAAFILNANRGITLGILGGTFDISGAAGSLSYAGIIQDTPEGPGSLTKIGTGVLELSGANTFTGGTTVTGGVLKNNGSLASMVSVFRGTFGGNGSVAAPVVVGDGVGLDNTAAGLPDAILSPGNSIGSMVLGSLTLNSDAIFNVEIDSAEAVADLITLLGAGNLGNGIADLAVTDLSNVALPFNTSFLIIDNTSTLDTTGFFDGLPDGATFSIGMNQYQIDYNAGAEENDVQLKVVPEPNATLLAIFGLTALVCTRRRNRSTRG